MILDRISYISAIEEVLNDHIEFSNLDISAGKDINYITNIEKRINSDLKLLKEEEVIGKNSWHKDDKNTLKISKNVFRNLLNVATKESFFIFNNKFYEQIDGVAMGYP